MGKPQRVDARASASALPATADIRQQLQGPIAQRLQQLIPQLAAVDDVYMTVMESPELLHACLQLFRKQRSRFADFLVDGDGHGVAADDRPLRCGRSVDEIIGMIVRSGARAYALKRFGEPKPDKAHVVHPQTQGLLRKLTALVIGKWAGEAPPPPGNKAPPSHAKAFYAAIKENLDYDWQVPLIPHYAELPVKLIGELGRGLTTLRTAEGIAALANIGRHSLDQARRILSDDMMREMLDHEPLAAQGVAFLGKAKYDFLHQAVYGRMGKNFWQMCRDVDRLEAMEDKNAKDLEQLASHLHIVGGHTINAMTDKLQVYQLSVFLDVARDILGAERFVTIFGAPGDKALIRVFVDKAAAFRLDSEDPAADFSGRCPDIFNAYLLNPTGYARRL